MTKIYLFKEVHKIINGSIEQKNEVTEWCDFDETKGFTSVPSNRSVMLTFKLKSNCCTERIERKLVKKHRKNKELTVVVNIDGIEVTLTGLITRIGVGKESIEYEIEATDKPKIEQRIDWNNVRGET